MKYLLIMVYLGAQAASVHATIELPSRAECISMQRDVFTGFPRHVESARCEPTWRP